MENCTILALGPEPPPLHSIPENASLLWAPLVKIKPRRGVASKIVSLANRCDWIVFTSPRGPKIVKRDAEETGCLEELVEVLGEKKIGVVGPSTAKSLEKSFGLKPHLVPREYRGESLGKELAALKPKCVLLARSSRGLKALPRILEENGVDYVELPVYDEHVDLRIVALIVESESRVDAVLLSSPLIAEAYCTSLHNKVKPRVIGVIGPTTLSTLEKSCWDTGVEVVVAPKYTYKDLIEAVASKCREKAEQA